MRSCTFNRESLMKRSLMLAALAATTLTACGGAPVDKTGRVPTIITLTGDATAGAKVYTDTCAGCHGPDG